MLYVYTGNGKGKTTASIGQVIRALGHGLKVGIVQLFKGEEFYGEQKVLKKLKNVDLFSYAQKHPFCFKSVKKEDVTRQCGLALEKVKSLIKGKKPYDLVILEEFNIATRDGFIPVKDLLGVLKCFPRDTDVFITGRGAAKELIELADMVTEMKEIKHPYNKNIKAKKGIEF